MNRLKLLRENNDLRQSDVANLLNISSVAYSYYENEKRDIPTNVLKSLADYYKVSIDYLLGKSNIRNPEELKKVQFANAGGLDTTDLDEDDLEELQRQIDYIKKMKGKK